jgi:peroxiredoxin
MKLSRRKLLFVLSAGAALGAALAFAHLSHKPEQRPVQVGDPAPAVTGTAVRGGAVSLTRLRGSVVLVSFLDLRADTTENEPSRAQIVFLRSMQTQHARFGLRVVLVDAADLAGAGTQSRSALVNDAYDWNLAPAIAVLGDDGTIARQFGVQRPPTTFLIGRRGVVRERWDGFVPAAQLDLALRELEGRGAAGS